MATLNLLPRKKFEIVLDDGSIIEGQYGTWALFRFCQKKGVGLSGLYELLAKLEVEDVLNFILCGVEQSCREKGESFTYTDFDACKWIDELGGLAGTEFIRLFNHYGDGEEKKSDEPAAPLLSGTDSSESPPAVA